MLSRLPPLLALALAAATPVAVEARRAYAEGERIQVTGTVIDGQGHAVEGVRVVLRASRVGWSFGAVNFRDRGRTVKDVAERAAVSDARGRFTIEWRWHDYYNRFDLVAGMEVKRSGRQLFEELARVDLTRRIRQGSPVVTSFTLENADRVATVERFEEAASSADERRVLEELGQPERIDVFDQPGYQEVTWWYFRLGRAYRFRDGRLTQVTPFEPVQPF